MSFGSFHWRFEYAMEACEKFESTCATEEERKYFYDAQEHLDDLAWDIKNRRVTVLSTRSSEIGQHFTYYLDRFLKAFHKFQNVQHSNRSFKVHPEQMYSEAAKRLSKLYQFCLQFDVGVHAASDLERNSQVLIEPATKRQRLEWNEFHHLLQLKWNLDSLVYFVPFGSKNSILKGTASAKYTH